LQNHTTSNAPSLCLLRSEIRTARRQRLENCSVARLRAVYALAYVVVACHTEYGGELIQLQLWGRVARRENCTSIPNSLYIEHTTTMLRRIRAKRAARQEKKAAKLQQKNNGTSISNTKLNVKAKSIFRSSLGKFPESPPAVTLTFSREEDESSSVGSSGYYAPHQDPAVTLTLSPEEEDETHEETSSVESSEYDALLSPASTISSSAPDTARKEDMAEKLLGGEQEKEMYDMKTVLVDELNELQDEVVVDKDDELFATKVELAFCNEALTQTEEELTQTKQACLSFMSKLEEKTAELTKTQSELITTKESLEAANATIESNGKLLQEKDEEIDSLEQSLTRGKRSAQAVLGMLTLGAIFTADDK